MEIERKWMVKGWPDAALPLLYEENMRQGYVSILPTVRIREETKVGEQPSYILCFKSKGRLSRKEIEMPIPKDKFEEIEDLIGLPLIPKVRRTYQLPDGHHLEVNHVDEGLPTEFWYAEVEYLTEKEALAWNPEEVNLADYLNDEVTNEPGQSMGAYWAATRMRTEENF
jgi:CYTH domain-containing protein